MRIRILLLLLLIPVLLLAGCRQTDEPSAEDLTIEVAVNPDPPAMGDATMIVTVTDGEGNPVDGATVSINANMSHAGMVPVIAETSESENGIYEIPFQWTMGGDWFVTVEVTLANGETASQEFEFNGVEGGMDDSEDMGDMDMEGTEEAMDMDDSEDMGDMDMGVEGVSGAYMTITNSTDADITLLSVSAEGVGMAQIHQSILENDVMRMEQMVDGLLIPAGETVELQPGGYHIMLMQLENDLVEGETLSLTLNFDNDTSITLDVPIASVNPEDGLSIESDGITLTFAWARPTALAGDHDMGDMDMEATEEAMDMDDSEDMDMESTEESDN